jgi:hypothetical protein
MPRVAEIAPDVFQISTLVPDADLRFNQFLIRDEEPLLYHTGMRSLFPQVMEAVAKLIPPARLPAAQAVTSFVGAGVFIDDYAARPPRVIEDGATFSTGARRFRLLHTPHFPHGWDASLLFEETQGVPWRRISSTRSETWRP